MKKFLLFLFLIGIVGLGIYIIKTQASRNLATLPTTTTTTIVTDKVIITDEVVNEEKENYLINVIYPKTNNEYIANEIKTLIDAKIEKFKQDAIEPSPNSQKMTLYISYATILNQDEILSLKFSEETYTGGAHPSHLVFTKNYKLSENIEIKYGDIILDETILKDLSDFALEYFKKQKFEFDLFLEGLDPKEENYSTFALTSDSLIFYFNEYQIAPYYAGSFELKVPYEILGLQTESEIE
jgi:peptidoglycan-N-acetylglucosamine deacetylase